MTCTCQVCKDICRWREVFKNGDIYSRMDAFEEMFGRIEEAETGRDVYKSIMNGTWPESVEILERSLIKAKEQNASNISV